MTKAAIEKTFAELDLDNSGTMSFKELRVALEKMKISLSSRSLAELWRAIDNDNSGARCVLFLPPAQCKQGVVQWATSVKTV